MSLSFSQLSTFNYQHHFPRQQLFRSPLGEAELAVGFQVSVSENIVLVLTIVTNQSVVCLRVKYRNISNLGSQHHWGVIVGTPATLCALETSLAKKKLNQPTFEVEIPGHWIWKLWYKRNPSLTPKVNLDKVQGQMFFCGVTCCPFQSRQKATLLPLLLSTSLSYYPSISIFYLNFHVFFSLLSLFHPFTSLLLSFCWTFHLISFSPSLSCFASSPFFILLLW